MPSAAAIDMAPLPLIFGFRGFQIFADDTLRRWLP